MGEGWIEGIRERGLYTERGGMGREDKRVREGEEGEKE